MNINILKCGAAAIALSAGFLAAPAALAQTSASLGTSGVRYDAARRVTGTISPDPDGSGPLLFRAVRNSYDSAGRLTKVERGTLSAWQSEAVAPANWTGFTAIETQDISYDAMGRKLRETLSGGGAVQTLVQTSYDGAGRLECQALRMNPAGFASPPASACTLGAAGSFGPDRITKNSYDAAGQLLKVTEAFGTADQADEVTNTYTQNGKLQTLTDAENNKTTYEYDGHDRLTKTFFPVPTKGALASSTTDYEQYGYDANGNRTSFRNRAGQSIGWSYDALNRATEKTPPMMSAESRTTYTYDLLGRMTSTRKFPETISFTWDALGRKLSETDPRGTVSSQYDLAGRRTRLTHPDGFFVAHDYLVTGEMTRIRENGATSGIGVLATFAYDDLGRRTSLTRGNGTSTSYSYDNASRLWQLTHDLAGTSHDLTLGFSYNPASQIVSNSRSNDIYAWTGHGSGTIASPANGLNQLSSIGGAAVTHDARGNVTYDPTIGYTFGYSSENLLGSIVSPTWSWSLSYDALMRLNHVASVLFGYDGDTRIGEYHVETYAPLNRYVHGPGVDEPLVEYSGTGLATRHFLHADERGSIIASSNDAGNVMNVGRYDENGKVQSYASRFGLAGMPIESVSGLYYARARMYNPRLPRFMQPDPIGYEDGPNLYAYVGGDPVNFADPSGETDIYIGGKADIVYKPVLNYYTDQARQHQDRTVQYFQWNQSAQIKDAIMDAQLRNEPINVIAHSWGTHTALEAAHDLNVRIDNLITVDPVSRSGDFSRPDGVVNWTNIVASPDSRRSDFSDIVAAIGGKRGELAGANSNVKVNATHGEFGRMMRIGEGAKMVEESYKRWKGE